MDDLRMPVSLNRSLDKFFKYLASYAVLELADMTMHGKLVNHFWGEMYIPRAFIIEKFLESYRR